MNNLFYRNKSKTRNRPVTVYLFSQISNGIFAVFGPDYIGHIYSGGQPRPGQGKRTGTVRHDDYGNGGRAADVHIYHKDTMDQVVGSDLAPLAQYWAAKKIGGVGLEMRGGGIHLDEWAKPPSKRAAMFWYYKYGAGTQARVAQIKAVSDGLRGIMPPLYVKPRQSLLSWLKSAIAGKLRRKT